MRGIVIYLLLLATISPALAEDLPTSGILYSERETNYLQYDCSPVGSNQLECDFIQTSVLKKDPEKVGEHIEKKLNQCVSELSEFDIVGAEKEKECKNLKLMFGAILGEIPLSKAIENLKNENPNFDATKLVNLSKAPEEVRAKIKDERDKIALFCEPKKDDAWCEKFVNLEAKKEKTTCRVFSNKFTQRFKRVIAENEAWSVISSPSGACGIVNVSRFELFKKYGIERWNYVSQKVITNPSGTDLIGSCSRLDAGVYNYSWMETDYSDTKKQCDYIKLGF